MRHSMPWGMTAALFLLMGIWSLSFFNCGPKVRIPPLRKPEAEPFIRVGILENSDQIAFRCPLGFRVIDDQGASILSSDTSGRKWSVRVKFGQPAEMVYRIGLYAEEDIANALRRAEGVSTLGHQPKIVQVGQELRLGTRVLNDNRKYWVTIGPYATKEEAAAYKETLPSEAVGAIITEISSPPLGVLDLVDPTGRVAFSSGEPFVLELNDPGEGLFTLFEVPVGRGFWWERQEDRSYRGKMEFRIGNDGKMLAVNELSLEDYLRGVLPSEMNPGFPSEALRAQAIAARSYTIAKLGIQHPLDPFDLCANVHCQVYSGTTKEHSTTSQAVEETRGHVLLYDGEVCATVYSAVCGGHTENTENVWGGQPQAYLVGVPDALPEESAAFPKNLSSDEEAVRRWVTSTPPVFCNHLSEETPSALHYARKHFRWSVTYSRQELEEILAQKTREKIGNLLDIIPISRGSSGRLIKVQIVGDAGQFMVEGELNIRRNLSPSHLRSACFVVDKEMASDGLPAVFVFQGAGWGHGVGMCQCGAAGMAFRGMNHREILSHYFQGTEVAKIYGVLF